MTRARWILLLLISTVLIAIFSRTLLEPGMFYMHDNTHVGRISEMRLALEAGQFPVAWTQNFGYGYGMPLFLFYGPLPFYLAVLATWAGWSDIGAMKLMFGLSGAVAFAGMFAWQRQRGWSSALPAALILLAAPYRAVDIYIRGALNEVLAIGFLPWVLVGALLMRRSPRLGVVLTAGSVAALLLTHNLTALIGLPLLGGLGALWLLLFSEKPWRKIGLYAGGSILGLLMAVFYVVPSLLEQSATSIGAILSGYFDFRLHFLYIRQLFLERWAYGGSEVGPGDGMSFHLGLPIVLAVVGAAIVFVTRAWQNWKTSQSRPALQRLQSILTRHQIWLIALSLTFGLSVFMTLSHSQPIWEALPLLQRVQFSWRFLGVSCVLGALLAGEVLASIRAHHWRWLAATVVMIAALSQARFHREERFIENPVGLYSSDPAVIRVQTSATLPDFIPVGFDQKRSPVEPNHRITLNSQILRPDFNQPHRMRFFIDDSVPGRTEWNIAHFPGWKYYVNDQEITPNMGGDGRAHLEVLTVPETIGAEFTPTPMRVQMQWVSLTAFVIWLALAVPWKHTTQKSSKDTHVSHK